MRVSQRSLSADRQAKPLRCFDLSDSPSLRDILFLFTQRRREAKPQRGLIFATTLLCAKKEERAEKQEIRDSSQLDFFAPLRLCEQKEKRILDACGRQALRFCAKKKPTCRSQASLLTDKFLCACLPQAGLCAFASKKRKSRETRDKKPACRQAGPDERLDFFAPSRLCEQKNKN